jgi:hypothetical protein
MNTITVLSFVFNIVLLGMVIFAATDKYIMRKQIKNIAKIVEDLESSTAKARAAFVRGDNETVKKFLFGKSEGD